MPNLQKLYAFGMEMPGRSIGSDFAYNFNGKRTDKWNGDNGSYLDFGARIHDARLGRFFTQDPLRKVFCDYSPYSFAANSPIAFSDYEGKGPIIKFCTSEVKNEKGHTTIKVHLEVELYVAVVNASSADILDTEGADIALSLQSSAFEGQGSGVLKGDGLGSWPTLIKMFLGKSNPNASIEYVVDIKQHYKYYTDIDKIGENENILALVDYHPPDDDQTRGGQALYHDGFASVDLNGCEAGGLYIRSLKSKLKRGNKGSHECGHFLGCGDQYLYTNFELVKNNPNSLMGNSSTFNLTQEDFDAIAAKSLMQIQDVKLKTKLGYGVPYEFSKKFGGCYLQNFGKAQGRVKNGMGKTGAKGKLRSKF